MRDEIKTLLDGLRKVPSNRILVDGTTAISSVEIIEQAEYMRNTTFFNQKNRSIAIQVIDDVLSFLVTLVALDGWVQAIFILPNGISDDVMSDLIKQSQVDYLYKGSQIISLLELNNLEVSGLGITDWILATSGTTGKPKLIKHNMKSLTATTLLNTQKGESFCWGLSYDSTRFAGLQVIFQSLLSGSRLVTGNHVSFDEMIGVFVEKKVNAISATPSWWRKLLMYGSASSLVLSRITLGGEIADQSILNQLKKIYPNAKVSHVYASTEAGVGFSVKDGKEGFPIEWLSTNPLGLDLKVSAENHLLIKPKVIAKGDEVVCRLSDDGYLDTEDMVEIKNKRVIFKGRASGAINIGGNKANPEEIEAVIRGLIEIQDVMVSSKANPIMGQIVVAELLLNDMQISKEEKQAIKKKVFDVCKLNLEDYKIPAMLKFVETLPYNSTGKLKRN